MAVVATRLACRSRFLYDIDSVNFALALERFDPAVHQPHPPGYYLYVCAGRLLSAVFHDANSALVAISITASALTAVLLYLLTRDWFDRRAALFAAGLFLVSPICWFHGTVALTYIVEAFFSVLIGFLCWHVVQGKSDNVVPAAIALGLSAGFRPSSLLFLGPLWVYSLLKCGRKSRIVGVAVLALTLAAWVVPMLASVGGVRAYFGPLWTLWKLVPARQNGVTGLPFAIVARAAMIGGVAALTFGAALFLFIRKSPNEGARREGTRAFAWIWIAPGLTFFSFVFLLFVNSGYLLIISPPVFAFLGLRASRWYETARNSRLRVAVIATAAAANVAIYLFAPFYCSYAEMRKFEANLVRATGAVRSSFDPEKTLVVGFDSHFLGYRHAAYYLPEFTTIEYPALRTAEGPRIFAVRNRRTELIRTLPSRYPQFVLFPLPDASDYKEYSARQLARFPEGCLQPHAGTDPPLVSGDVHSLAYLFSETAGVVVGSRREEDITCKQSLTQMARRRGNYGF